MATGTARRRNKTNTAFNLAILCGMMVYLALATAGFAFLGATRVLPDMATNVQWLSIVAVSSGLVAAISFFFSKR